MNLKLNVVRLDNEDVIATSCAWEVVKNQYNPGIFNTPSNVDDGKSFKYNGEISGQIGPDSWIVWNGDLFFDSKGNLIGTVTVDDDTSYFKSGSHYHSGYLANGDYDIWVECKDPSHYSSK